MKFCIYKIVLCAHIGGACLIFIFVSTLFTPSTLISKLIFRILTKCFRTPILGLVPNFYNAAALLATQSAVIAMAIPSVHVYVCPLVYPSVTRWYCTQTNEDRIMRSSTLISRLIFRIPKMFVWLNYGGAYVIIIFAPALFTHSGPISKLFSTTSKMLHDVSAQQSRCNMAMLDATRYYDVTSEAWLYYLRHARTRLALQA